MKKKYEKKIIKKIMKKKLPHTVLVHREQILELLVTKILREINFEDCRCSKTAIFKVVRGSDSEFLFR